MSNILLDACSFGTLSVDLMTDSFWLWLLWACQWRPIMDYDSVHYHGCRCRQCVFISVAVTALGTFLCWFGARLELVIPPRIFLAIQVGTHILLS